MLGRQCRVKQYRITVVHNRIILAVHKKHRRTVLWHMPFQREPLLQCHVACTRVPHQSPPRALMGTRLHHRHHRIDGYDKSGAVCRAEELRCRHGQMPSCREAHHPDILSVDAIFRSMALHMADGLQQVILRIRIPVPSEHLAIVEYIGRNVCRTVVEHKGRNALLLQPSGHALPLRLHVMPEVAASRTHNDCHVPLSRNLIRCQHHLLLTLCPLPDVHLSVYLRQRKPNHEYCQSPHLSIL